MATVPMPMFYGDAVTYQTGSVTYQTNSEANQGSIWYEPYGSIWHWGVNNCRAATVNYVTGQNVFATTTASAWPTVTYTWPADTNATAPYMFQYQYNGGSAVIEVMQPPETPEQRAVRERMAAEWRAKEDKALKRAEELLFMHLSDGQREQYLAKGYFDAPIKGRLYRINKGRAGNVELIEAGAPKYRYCIHPRDYTPAPDAMLAQLLMLETDEDRFLKTANRSRL